MAKNKHLTDVERLEIEHGLRHGLSLKKIAAGIGKHHSTVAREILARSVESGKGAYGRVTNRCVSRHSCGKTQLCNERPDCVRRCSLCRPTSATVAGTNASASCGGTGVDRDIETNRLSLGSLLDNVYEQGTTSVSSVYNAVKDHLGSVRALVDASGAVVASYTYDA